MEQRKEELRRSGIERLKKIAASGSKKQKEQRIYSQLYASDSWKQAKVIGITISSEFEVATQPIIEQARVEGKIIVVPKTLPKRQMTFYEWTKDTMFKRSSFGVLEPVSNQRFLPEEIDLLIVPGLVYHPEGYRIGFGGGYYDRYLKRYSNATCSLVFRELLNSEWEPESFDQKIQQLWID